MGKMGELAMDEKGWLVEECMRGGKIASVIRLTCLLIAHTPKN